MCTALICECHIFIPFIPCQSENSFCWVAYRDFFLFREVGSGINVIMSEMACNFFGIVAQSIQRKTFLREFSTNGKSLSHFHCDCRNCQMLLKFFVLYLLFVDEFYKGYFLLYSYMSIHELRHIFDAFCYIAALLNKF